VSYRRILKVLVRFRDCELSRRRRRQKPFKWRIGVRVFTSLIQGDKKFDSLTQRFRDLFQAIFTFYYPTGTQKKNALSLNIIFRQKCQSKIYIPFLETNMFRPTCLCGMQNSTGKQAGGMTSTSNNASILRDNKARFFLVTNYHVNFCAISQ